MSNKPTILCDMDGTIVDVLSELRHEMSLIGIKEKNKTYYDLYQRYNAHCPFLKAKIDGILANSEFWANLKPYPNAIETINKLKSFYNIILITNLWEPSKQSCKEGKVAWITKWLPDLSVVFGRDSNIPKSEYYIDDNIDNINEWAWNFVCCKPILIDRDYNINNDRVCYYSERLKDWKEIWKYFSWELKNEKRSRNVKYNKDEMKHALLTQTHCNTIYSYSDLLLLAKADAGDSDFEAILKRFFYKDKSGYYRSPLSFV